MPVRWANNPYWRMTWASAPSSTVQARKLPLPGRAVGTPAQGEGVLTGLREIGVGVALAVEVRVGVNDSGETGL